jgi:hypothetical protein
MTFPVRRRSRWLLGPIPAPSVHAGSAGAQDRIDALVERIDAID